MISNGIDLGFCTERFPAGTHMCLIFRDERERRRTVARFVESGLAEGERVYYFADTATTEEVDTWLAGLDVDTGDARSAEAFIVGDALDAYCPDGTFLPERMCDSVRAAYRASLEAYFANSRVTGEMTWALRGAPGSEMLIEYESAINDVVKEHPITAMCQYDANRFSDELIFRALQVHPYLVMNGQLIRNPHYITGE
jgi:hypothetical protein